MSQSDKDEKKSWSVFRAIRSFLSKLGTVWCVVGMCLIAVIGLEVVLRLMWLAKDSYFGAPQDANRVFAWEMDENKLQSWMKEYWHEFLAQRMVWQPYVQWRRKPFEGKYINVDERGIRRTWTDPTLAEVPASKRFRIFVLGGSTVWGSGARDDATVPSHLAKLLSSEELPVEVVNLGETAYVNTQELITLMLHLREGDVPDLVIFYDGVNDTFSSYQNHVAGVPHNERNRQVEFNLLNDPRRLHIEFVKKEFGMLKGQKRLADATAQLLGLRGTATDEHAKGPASEQDLAQKTVEIYEANVELADMLADDYGFTCQFYWQPVVYTKQYPTEFESRLAAARIAHRFFSRAVYGGIESSEALRQNQRFRNLSSAFDGVKDECYLDFAHLKEEANEIIARAMLPHVTSIIRERMTQGSDRPVAAER